MVRLIQIETGGWLYRVWTDSEELTAGTIKTMIEEILEQLQHLSFEGKVGCIKYSNIELAHAFPCESTKEVRELLTMFLLNSIDVSGLAQLMHINNDDKFMEFWVDGEQLSPETIRGILAARVAQKNMDPIEFTIVCRMVVKKENIHNSVIHDNNTDIVQMLDDFIEDYFVK
jgi:hypothetical protein